MTAQLAYTILVLILVAALYTAHRTNEALRRRVDSLEAALQHMVDVDLKTLRWRVRNLERDIDEREAV